MGEQQTNVAYKFGTIQMIIARFAAPRCFRSYVKAPVGAHNSDSRKFKHFELSLHQSIQPINIRSKVSIHLWHESSAYMRSGTFFFSSTSFCSVHTSRASVVCVRIEWAHLIATTLTLNAPIRALSPALLTLASLRWRKSHTAKRK